MLQLIRPWFFTSSSNQSTTLQTTRIAADLQIPRYFGCQVGCSGANRQQVRKLEIRVTDLRSDGSCRGLRCIGDDMIVWESKDAGKDQAHLILSKRLTGGEVKNGRDRLF